MTGSEYFDLNAILCEEASIPVQFNLDIPANLASLLDAPAGSRDVKEMPYWLVQEVGARGFVTATMPKSFGKKVQNKLKADAMSVPLGSNCPHYYELGMKLAIMDQGEDGQDLVQALSSAFSHRVRGILDRFQNTEDRNAMKYLNSLTTSEQRIYSSAQLSLRHHATWKRRGMETIEHAPIVRMTKRTRH